VNILLNIDLNIFLDNNIFDLKILVMKFAIKCPLLFRGLITSTGFAGRSFFILEGKEVML